MRELRRGRAEIERRLTATLDERAQQQGGTAILIEGEAGIGKTTLLTTLAATATDAGMRVWWADATASDHSTPFATIDRLHDHGDRVLGSRRLVSTVDGAPLGVQSLADVQRFSAVEEIADLVESRLDQPTLLILDDAHAADTASIEALIVLIRLSESHPLVVLAARRPETRSTALAQLAAEVQEVGGVHTRLPPLDDAEVERFVRQITGSEPPAAVWDRVAGAGGNPFLLEQCVRGLLETSDGAADTMASPLPSTLAGSVEARLADLGELGAAVVRAAAVQGGRVDMGLLATQMARPAVSLAEPVQAAVRAGFLDDSSDSLVFRHELVREAVYDSMPAPVRAAAHSELARALTAHHAPPALVGTHLILSDAASDPRTVDRLVQAATDTTLQAPDAALEFLDRARDLAGDDLAARRVIERARMEALTAAGRLTEAEASAHWLLASVEDSARSELKARLGGMAMIAGDGERAKDLLDEAAGTAGTDRDRSPILALAALNSAAIGDYGRAAELAERAAELGQENDEPVGESVGLALTARMSTYTNSIDHGLRLGAQAVAIADNDPTGDAHQYIPALHYGMTAFDADQLDLATATAERGVQLAVRYRISWSIPLYGTLKAAVHYRRGQLDDARAEATTAVELAQRTRSRHTLAWAQALLALVAVDAGEADDAQGWASAATATVARGESRLGIDHVALAAARAAEIAGDVGTAARSLAASWDQFEEGGLTFCQPLVAYDLARLARLRDDPTTEARVSGAVRSAAEMAGVPAITATADWIEAVSADDRTAARRALDAMRRTERRLEVGRWLMSGAELLAEDPAEPLHEAVRLFGELGAVGSAHDAQRRLQALGHVEPLRAVTGWDSLTRTELTIAQMLGEGCTNAEIAQRRGCSRRTIESHLVRIYQKLAIDGRSKLTVAAALQFGEEPRTGT